MRIFPDGPMTWKVMQGNAWKYIVNLQTKRLKNDKKSQLHVFTTINLKKKRWDLFKNCQKFAMLEKNIDDFWNVDGDRELSDSWTAFTRFTVLDEKPQDGKTWSGWRLTRKQTTSRPDTLWPEIWKDMSEASKRKKKSKSGRSRNQKLDNGRRLRGIYFIDPDDEEFKDIMKNACRKLVAMPCKTCRTVEEDKTKHACEVEADGSMRKRMEGPPLKFQEDHIAGKRMNSLSHYNLVRKLIPMSYSGLTL